MNGAYVKVGLYNERNERSTWFNAVMGKNHFSFWLVFPAWGWNNLQIENGEIVVGVGVMRMRANGVVEAQLGLSNGQLFAAIAVVQVVSPGQQNGPQIVESAGVVGPQSAKQTKQTKQTNQLLYSWDTAVAWPSARHTHLLSSFLLHVSWLKCTHIASHSGCIQVSIYLFANRVFSFLSFVIHNSINNKFARI